MTVSHLWINDETRISIDDENPKTEGQCISLRDGECLTDDDEEEWLDVEAMDHRNERGGSPS
jgi:hypothetical protein